MDVANVSNYFDFFREYYGSSYNIFATALSIALVAACLFYLCRRDSRIRSLSLLAIMVMLAFLWTFLLSSLAFCMILIQDYLRAPTEAISLAAKLSLIFSLMVVPVIVLVLRDRAASRVYANLHRSLSHPLSEVSGSSSLVPRISRIFDGAVNVRPGKNAKQSVDLIVTEASAYDLTFLSESAALDWRGRKIIAISSGAALLLDDQELASVLSHELGHIENRDPLLKTIATVLKSSFFFDPFLRLLEASLYRELELGADVYSARTTHDPSSLASALIKIHQYLDGPERAALPSRVAPAGPGVVVVSPLLSISSRTKRFLAKEPPLNLRVRRLLEIEEQMSST